MTATRGLHFVRVLAGAAFMMWCAITPVAHADRIDGAVHSEPSVRLAGLTYSAVAWTDADGDGLRDCGPANPFSAAAGETLTVDVWIDSGSFAWWSYFVTVRWVGSDMTLVGSEVLVTGDGDSFEPVVGPDQESLGFGGSGFQNSGSQPIGRVHLLKTSAVNTCVYPVLDLSDPMEFFSQLDGPTSETIYFLEGVSSCFE